MGRALEPGGRFPVVLDWDLDKPVDKRPTIYTVALSMRKQEWLGELLDNLPQETTREFFNAIENGLAEVIVDWANFNDPKTGEPIPYRREAIRDVFTHGEAWELFRKVLASGSQTKADEKKSD